MTITSPTRGGIGRYSSLAEKPPRNLFFILLPSCKTVLSNGNGRQRSQIYGETRHVHWKTAHKIMEKPAACIGKLLTNLWKIAPHALENCSQIYGETNHMNWKTAVTAIRTVTQTTVGSEVH
jgi:hypothetical protein